MNRSISSTLTLWLSAALLLPLTSTIAFGHGHAAAIDPDQPDAWKYKLCSQMTTVAIQALYDRDKGRPMKIAADDGELVTHIANTVIQKVYAEPAISSPKRANTFGRAFCNEQLQSMQ
jgi:hypothetical protein